MKEGALGRGFKNTFFVTTAIILIPSSIVVLAGSVVLDPSSVIKVAYAIEKFDIDTDIEHNEIERGDTQHITVTVRNEDTNNRVSDADVRLTVDPPDSASSSATDETDDDGEARFDVKIDDDAETGNYDVEVRVSKKGYDTETVSTSFEVIRADRGDESSVTVSASAAASSSSSNAPSAAVGTGSASTGGSRFDSSPSGAAGASTSPDK